MLPAPLCVIATLNSLFTFTLLVTALCAWT